MKISYCNLKTVHLTWNGNFRKGSDIYIEMEACKICGEPYLAVKSRPTIFCSKSCGKMGKKRGPMPKEQRLKISKAIGGENHPFYGKHLSEEHRQNLRGPKTKEHRKNLSVAAKKRFKIKENHPSWKGGVRKKNIPLYDTFAHQISYVEEVRRSPENSDFLEVKCAFCCEWFMPKTHSVQDRIRALNTIDKGDSRFYCSETCKIKCPTYRVHKYPKDFKRISENSSHEGDEIWKQEVIKRNIEEHGQLQCEICGNTNKNELSVHHEKPQKTHPEMSLDPDNGWMLCSFGKGNNCHLKYGHPKGTNCSTAELAKLVCKRKQKNNV
jgi:hypothetical protein